MSNREFRAKARNRRVERTNACICSRERRLFCFKTRVERDARRSEGIKKAERRRAHLCPWKMVHSGKVSDRNARRLREGRREAPWTVGTTIMKRGGDAKGDRARSRRAETGENGDEARGKDEGGEIGEAKMRRKRTARDGRRVERGLRAEYGGGILKKRAIRAARSGGDDECALRTQTRN